MTCMKCMTVRVVGPQEGFCVGGHVSHVKCSVCSVETEQINLREVSKGD